MAVLTTPEKRRLRGLHQAFRALVLDARLSKLDSDGTYTGALGSDVTSTTANALTINSDSSNPKVKFSVPDTGTGDYTLTIAAPGTLAANRTVTLPDPGSGTFYWAVTTNSDGSVASGAMTGTTATSFEIDTDGSIPAMALGVGTTGDYTITLKPTATITGNRDVLFQDAAGTVCLTTGTPETSFTVYSGGATAKIKLDTNSATGNFTLSIVPDNLTANHTITMPNLTGTVALTSAKQSITVLGSTSGGIVLSPTATGSYNTTIANQSMAAARTITLPDPGADNRYFALTTSADGAVTSTGATGTTAAAFETDTDGSVPALALGSQAAGTGDYTLTIKPATTLTGNADVVIPDGADTFCMIGATQTLASKTLASPHFSGGAMTLDAAVTVSGTWANLGTVTTVDINGGTVDGVTIGGAAAGAASFTTASTSGLATLASASVTTTLTVAGSAALNGGITVDSTNFTVNGTTGAVDSASTIGGTAFTADDATTPTFQTASGKTNTGYFEVLGKTSGGTRLSTADATAQTVTITTAAQTGGAGVALSIPDMAAASGTFAMVELANTFTVAQIVDLDHADDNNVQDVLTLKRTHLAGNGASGIGGNISLWLDNDAGTEEEHASIQWTSDAADGAEDSDIILSSMLAGTVTEGVRLDASDQSLTIGRNATDANGMYQLRIFPLTASMGSLLITAADSAGDTVTQIVNASQAGARVYTIPDAGASTSFVMGAGAQTVAGLKTLTTAPVLHVTDANTNTVLDALVLKREVTGAGVGAAGVGTGISVIIEDDGGGLTEVAAMDFSLSSAGAGTEDVKFEVTGLVGGASKSLFAVDANGTYATIGDAAGASIYLLKIYPTTGSKGALYIQSNDNTNDVNVSVGNAAHTNARAYTFGEAAGDKYVAYTDNANGAPARADMEQEANAIYRVPLMTCRNANGTVMDATGGAGLFSIANGGYGAGTLVLNSEGANGNTKTDTLCFEFALPPEYDDGETVTIKVHAKYSGAGTVGTKTLDLEAYELDAEGATAGDICGTAIQTLTTSFASYSFTITPAGLAAGDKILVFVQAVIQESISGGALTVTIGDIRATLDIKG